MARHQAEPTAGYHVLWPGDVDEAAMYDAGYRYEDLVRAVDVVVTKPGYGIISECIANDTALLYTSRGDFREYPVLVEAMPKYLRCAYIEQDELLSGNWQPHLDRLLAQAVSRQSLKPATQMAAESRCRCGWSRDQPLEAGTFHRRSSGKQGSVSLCTLCTS